MFNFRKFIHQSDKWLHCGVSYALALTLFLLAFAYQLGVVTSVLFASVLTFGVGVLKEFWDFNKKGGQFEKADLLADAIGVALAVVVMVLFLLIV